MGLDYELETLKFPPRVFDKGYKEINPLGTVPCLVDGGVKMTESAGICEYLGVKYGPTPLAVTPDEPDYAHYLNWLHRSDATLTFPLALVFRYSALEPEERRLPQVAEDYRKWFLGRWRCVDEALETRDYLCAERFTMADICIGFSLHFARLIGIEEAMTPNVEKWWDRLTAREAYQRAIKP